MEEKRISYKISHKVSFNRHSIQSHEIWKIFEKKNVLVTDISLGHIVNSKGNRIDCLCKRKVFK